MSCLTILLIVCSILIFLINLIRGEVKRPFNYLVLLTAFVVLGCNRIVNKFPKLTNIIYQSIGILYNLSMPFLVAINYKKEENNSGLMGTHIGFLIGIVFILGTLILS